MVNNKLPSRLVRLGREYFFWLVAVGWTLLLLFSFSWNIQNSREQINNLIQAQARTAYEKDVLYRFWNSIHATVYVPVSEKTPPNPYLEVPDRDITTPGGINLTLMNPAYMTRQANELGLERLGIYGHLTSLKPLRPENAPDAWERQALLAFEEGVTEVSSVEEMDGKQLLRLMRPLLVEKECIDCHAKQNYTVGQIRGGISVSIDMAPSLALQRSTSTRLAISHILLWLMGLAGLLARIRMLAKIDLERQASADELQQANAQLEHRVSERTLELKESNRLLQEDILQRKAAEQEKERLAEQLRQSQKMEILGTLAGGIAHDFNNLLTPILGYAELAQQRPEISASLNKDINQIASAAERAKGLVQQILSFSRRTEQQRTVVSMQQIVGEVFELIRPSCPKTIEIELQLPEKALLVEADPDQLHQVLMNLCTNAWHAMLAQEGLLVLSLERVQSHRGTLLGQEEAEQDYVCLKVRDSGRGIDALNKEKIFEPFFTTKKAGEGTGLGLSVVHGIVHSHGGAIVVESSVGQGSCFQVYLPLVNAESSVDPLIPVQQGRGERILLVDDEVDIVEMFCEGLQAYGFKVSGFTRGNEALEEFRADPDGFDLLLSDRFMPGLSGQQLAEAIRAIRPDFPVIFMTGYDDPPVATLKQASLSDRCLIKPLTSQEVARQIVQQLTEP